MRRLICTLPNASTTINGIAFTEDRGQMVSEPVPDDVAEQMATIPGYMLVPEAPPQVPSADTTTEGAAQPTTDAAQPATAGTEGAQETGAAAAPDSTTTDAAQPATEVAAKTGAEDKPAKAGKRA